MNTNFDTLLESLADMSTDALNASARRLARTERRYTAELICHLVEIMDRKVYLELGYANIFVYCVDRLGFSEAATQLRRQVAGAARRFSQLLEAMADLRISLSVAAKVAPHLTEDNVGRVLADCSGMTLRQATEYSVTLAPKPVVRSGIRRQPRPSDRLPSHHASAEQSVNTEANGTPLNGQSHESARPVDPVHPAHMLDMSRRTPSLPDEAVDTNTAPMPPKRAALVEPARPDVFNFRFAASRKFKDALVRLAEVTGLHPERDMAELLERAVECALDKSDPQRKHERRIARHARQTKQLERQTVCAKTDCASNAGQPHRSNDVTRDSMEEPADAARQSAAAGIDDEAIPVVAEPQSARPHLARAVRDRILARAGQRCEHRGPDGRRCTCRTGLQIEHDPPFAVTGSHDEGQLKTFCSNHNRLAAERFFGKAFIDEKIALRRSGGQTAQNAERAGACPPAMRN